MSAAFSPPSFMVMPRPLGSSSAFSIDSLIGGPTPPGPGAFVYTGYPMFMPYRSVVLQPPPALPAGHHLQGGFCSGLAPGMALSSGLMAALPGGFPPHREPARKFSPARHAEDGKSFLAKEAFHDPDPSPGEHGTGSSRDRVLTGHNGSYLVSKY